VSSAGEILVKVGADTSGFQSGIGGVIEKLGGLGTVGVAGAVAAAGAAIAKFTMDSVAHARSLDDAMKGFRVATGASAEEAERFSGTVRELFRQNTDSVESLSEAVTTVRQRFGDLDEEMVPVTQTFLDYAKVTGQDTAQAVDQLADIMNRFGLEATEAGTLTDALAAAAQATGAPIGSLQDALLGSSTQMQAMGFSVKESVAFLATFERAGVDAGSAIRGLNSFIGNTARISDTQAQALDLLGVSLTSTHFATDRTAKAAKEYGIELRDGQQLTAEQAEQLQALGVQFDSVNRLTGTHRESLAEMFETMSSGNLTTEQLQAAMSIFGARAGPELLAALQSGTLGLEEMMALVEESTGTVTSASAVYDQQLGERWTLITRKYLEPFMAFIGGAFLGALEALIGFVEVVAERAEAAWAFISENFKSMFESVEGDGNSLMASLASIWDSIVVVIGAAFDALVALWQNVLKPAWEAIRPLVDGLFGALEAIFRGNLQVFEALFRAFAAFLQGDFEGAWNALSDAVQAISRMLASALSSIWGGVVGVLQNVWNNLATAASETWDAVAAGVKAGVDAAWGAITSAWGGLVGFVSGLWDGVAGAVKDGVNAVIESVNGLIRAWNGIEFRTPDIPVPSVTIPNPLGDDWKIGGGTIPGAGFRVPQIPTIPALASGGLVLGPTLALVGEAGPELVTPLDRLPEFGRGEQTIVIELDGRVLSRAVAPRFVDELRLRTGVGGA
jgi:TP901 family phage tail tape measure protein